MQNRSCSPAVSSMSRSVQIGATRLQQLGAFERQPLGGQQGLVLGRGGVVGESAGGINVGARHACRRSQAGHGDGHPCADHLPHRVAHMLHGPQQVPEQAVGYLGSGADGPRSGATDEDRRWRLTPGRSEAGHVEAPRGAAELDRVLAGRAEERSNRRHVLTQHRRRARRYNSVPATVGGRHLAPEPQDESAVG